MSSKDDALKQGHDFLLRIDMIKVINDMDNIVVFKSFSGFNKMSLKKWKIKLTLPRLFGFIL